MALQKVSPGLLPAENYGRFNAAFDAIDGLSPAIAAVQSASQATDAELLRQIGGLRAALSSTAGTRDVQELARQSSLTDQALQKQILDNATSQAAAIAENLRVLLAGNALAVGRMHPRPGDVPSAFTASKAGGPSDALPIWAGQIASTPGGATARLTGAGVLAQRGYTAIEPGRSYRLRNVYSRTSDVSDPAGDAVRTAVLCFDANKRPLAGNATFVKIKDAKQVKVAYGAQPVTATLARAAGPGIAFVLPAGTVYVRAYVETYGQDGSTDVSLLDVADISDATVLDPVSTDVANRVGSLESVGTGPRLTALEQAAGTPNALTFATRSNAAAATIPSTVNTVIVLGLTAASDGGGSSFRRAQAGETVAAGSGDVFGFTSADGAGWLRVSANQTAPITPYDFPGKVFYGAQGIDHTQAFQAMVNAGIAQFPRPTDGSGLWRVSKITAGRGNGLLLGGSIVLLGIATSAQTAVFETFTTGVVQTGVLKIAGKFDSTYDRGAWIYATTDSTPQYSLWQCIRVDGCAIGVELGNVFYPSELTSEVVVMGGGTYGCPTALKVSGTETYVTILGGTWSGDTNGGNAAWQARTRRVLLNVGAHAILHGIEGLITGSVDGYVLEAQPLTGNRGEGTMWGSSVFVGCFLESAAPLWITTNPAQLIINQTAGNRGLISFLICRGFHSQDRAPWGQFSSDYDGDLYCYQNRWWYPGTRTQPDIFGAGGAPKAHIYMDRQGWGDGFTNHLGGVSGCVVHFEFRQILRVLSIVGQLINATPNSPVPIKFQATDPARENARFAGSYAPATGTFTFTQPYTDVDLNAFVNVPGANGTLFLNYNGALTRARPFIGGFGRLDWKIKSVKAGDTVQIVITTDISNGIGDSGIFTSEMTIYASA